MFVAIGLAWKLGGFGGVMKLVPRWLWIALAAAVVIFLAYKVTDGHFHRGLQTARAEASAARDAAWQKRLDKAHADALVWKQKYETTSTQLATARRNANDKELQDIAARGGALLVRGPGQATAPANCRPINNSGIGATSGGRDAANRPSVPGVVGMPENQALAIVPWDELVRRGQLCDANRTESLTWRAHDVEQRRLRRNARPDQ